MRLVMFLAVCLVLGQFRRPYSWLVSGGSEVGGLPGVAGSDPTLDILVRDAVDRLQMNSALAANVSDRLVREVAVQLAHDIMAAGCPKVKHLAGPSPVSAATVPPPPPPQQPPLIIELSRAPPRTVYIITPTYRRPEQIPDLTRMAQTLMHVPHIFWLVIEDAQITTSLVTELLNRTGIPYVQLTAPMPQKYRNIKGPKPKGVSNRLRGLDWLRANATTGVFYFADDDNTYDIRLFKEIRTTQKVAMWPVGICSYFGLSTPIVEEGTFKGFYDGWGLGRKFIVDMAGFAVSVEFLLKRPNASMPFKSGSQEDGFLNSLAPFEPSEIELKAENCSKILVWHTRTVRNPPAVPVDLKKYKNTNLVQLKEQIV